MEQPSASSSTALTESPGLPAAENNLHRSLLPDCLSPHFYLSDPNKQSLSDSTWRMVKPEQVYLQVNQILDFVKSNLKLKKIPTLSVQSMNRLNTNRWGSLKVVSINAPRSILRGRVNNIFWEGTHGVYYGSGSTYRSIKASLLTAASGRATQLYWQHCSVDTECTPGLNPKRSGLSFSLQIKNCSTLKSLTMDLPTFLVTTRFNRTKRNAWYCSLQAWFWCNSQHWLQLGYIT